MSNNNSGDRTKYCRELLEADIDMPYSVYSSSAEKPLTKDYFNKIKRAVRQGVPVSKVKPTTSKDNGKSNGESNGKSNKNLVQKLEELKRENEFYKWYMVGEREGFVDMLLQKLK